MLDAFEKQIDGLATGDVFLSHCPLKRLMVIMTTVASLSCRKNTLEVDGKIDEEMLSEGNTLPMMDASGNRLVGSVVSIGENQVTMDFNHPLAGETMHFKGTVMEVRDATAEEIAALFSSSGCGCGSGWLRLLWRRG